MKFLSSLSLILSRVAMLQVLWKNWDIRSFLIASFTFQVILIVAAPLRKRSSDLITRASLWASYLLADWVAAQAIGLIIRATEPGCQSVTDDDGYLFSFWAQFLLVHLGGPDTITALALEDNELWLRTGLHLGVQAYGSLGVLFRSTRSSGLWAATVLMFLAGIIKYLERVMSLFHGRLSDFNDSPREYLKQLMEDQTMETNVEMVRDAFNLFQCHKRLFADRRLSLDVRRNTPEYFIKRTHEEAYKLLEIQLNFTYEAIYTKMVVIHKARWKILRVVVLFLEVVALVIWCLVGKQGYPHYDIRITYTLIVGAIAVDVFAFLRIQLSDWSIARLNKKPWWMICMPRSGFYNLFLAARTGNWNKAESSSTLVVWFRRVFLQRWSESIHQLDEVEVDQKDIKRRKVIEILGLEKFVWRYSGIVKRKRVSSDIWKFLFDVLKNHHRNGGDDKNKHMVMVENGKHEDIDSLVDRAFPTPTLEEDYLTAMSICKKLGDGDGMKPTTSDAEHRKEISFALKKYISYLLIFQPNMMFGATDKNKLLTKSDRFFGRQEADEKYNTSSDEENYSHLQEQRMKNYNLAKKILDEIKCEDENEKQWEFIARAWVKLVCYAAIKCRPNVHAQQLKQGGEFLSFVWLLMVHLDFKKETASDKQ